MFGENLKMLRLARGLSQKELGDLSQIGQSNISAWERGERSPLPEGLIKIATFFGCSIDFLVGYSVKPIDEEENLLIQKYRTLDKEAKNQLNDYVDKLLCK